MELESEREVIAALGTRTPDSAAPGRLGQRVPPAAWVHGHLCRHTHTPACPLSSPASALTGMGHSKAGSPETHH